MNIERVIHALYLVTNKISKGGIGLNFSVRKFVFDTISCFRITLFLQILRQSLGIWGKGDDSGSGKSQEQLACRQTIV
jgi:hypothetical protein